MYCFRGILLVLQLILGNVFTANGDTNKFVEYKNLWLENLAKAAQWTQPTENSQFKNVRPNERCQPIARSYDFVIVGGGTAGSVLANRLSENPRWDILVLEAGGDETPFTLIPGAYLTSLRSEMNWGYTTEPQVNACLQMPGGRCPLPRGKVLGGESAMKDVTYVRGNLKDFDSWGPWWSHNALKYFKVMENATALDVDRADEKYRGSHGHFHVEYPKNPGPLTKQIFDGFKDLGFDVLKDYNGETQIGVGNLQAYTKNGERSSTNQRYLQPIINRPNLKVITNALATKIIFSKKHHDRKAQQLEYYYNGSCYSVNITKELLLTSGPINTPQLLMLSGIGPEAELKRHNIPLILNLSAVGQHLEDHLSIRDFTFQVNKSFGYGKFDDELKSYLEDGRGCLAEPLARQVSFVNTRCPNSANPDFEMMFVEANPQLYYPPANLSEPHTLIEFSAQILLLHPRSRGSISLKSNDPTDYPIIDPKYLQSRHDMLAMVRILRFMKNLERTKSFRKMNATIVGLVPDACQNEHFNKDPFEDDELLVCIIKHKTAPMHHQIGTCRMGRDRKKDCVDEDLRVHGVRNLRVVDSSAIPKSTSGHTIPVVVLMAEAAADFIKATY